MAGNDPGRVPNVKPVSQNGFTLDMFGRLKVGTPTTLFDSQHRYKASGDFSDEITGTASATYLPNESTVSLGVGTSSGDKITRESRRVFPYQPGKSLQVMQTFVFSPGKANLRQRAGYFSRQNGVYLELEDFDLRIVKRGYTSGSVEEVRVAQSEWNIDTLIGDGRTDYQLDIAKAQIFFIEVEWLGAGSVRCGFVINGVPITVHRFDHANIIDSVYMTTAALPIRYEVENLAATASNSAMKQICATVISNGGYTRQTENWSAARTTTVNVGSDFYPLVSIRLHSGREDAVIIPSQVDILPIAQGNYEFALVRNATITGGTWVQHAPSTGNVDYNISATAMTGGTVVYQGLTSSSNQARAAVSFADILRFDLQLGRTNAAAPVSDTLTVALRSLAGTQSGIAALSWVDLV